MVGVGHKNEGCDVGAREFSRVIIVLPDYSQKSTTGRSYIIGGGRLAMSIVQVHELLEGRSPLWPLEASPPKPLGLSIEGLLVTLGGNPA